MRVNMCTPHYRLKPLMILSMDMLPCVARATSQEAARRYVKFAWYTTWPLSIHLQVSMPFKNISSVFCWARQLHTVAPIWCLGMLKLGVTSVLCTLRYSQDVHYCLHLICDKIYFLITGNNCHTTAVRKHDPHQWSLGPDTLLWSGATIQSLSFYLSCKSWLGLYVLVCGTHSK